MNNINIFTFIKDRIAILDAVQEFTTLRRAGSYWKARCPFHHEKTASFTVSPDKNIFYCFGCHTGGDVIAFIQKVEQCSALEAAQYLAQRYNITLPDTSKNTYTTSSNKQERNHYFSLCKQVAIWCNNNLHKNPSALRYFYNRGFTKESINYFTLGYFSGGSSSIKTLLQKMRTNNILADDLIKARILSQSKTSLYSPFEQRLIFPIKDHLGDFCGFGGRTFNPNDTRPKYYNSHENEYFTKGSLLFGLDAAKKTIQKTGIVFLVEGYTDCIAMVQHGFANTVATLGTACTENHLKLLSRYTQQVHVLYDNDSAGTQATIRLTELCWQFDLELNVVCLPKGHDPASFLAQKNELGPYIDKAKDIFVFFIESLGKDFSSKPMTEKMHLTQKLINIIRIIDNTLKQSFLLQKASKALDIPYKTLQQELAKNRKISTRGDKQEKAPFAKDISPKNTQTLEKRIFCAIMNNIQILNNGDGEYIIAYISEPFRSILDQLHKALQADSSVDFNHFFNMLGPKRQLYVSKLLIEYGEIISEKEFQQLKIQLLKKQWKIIINDIIKKLAQAKQEGNSVKTEKILQDFLTLKQKIIPVITRNYN